MLCCAALGVELAVGLLVSSFGALVVVHVSAIALLVKI